MTRGALKRADGDAFSLLSYCFSSRTGGCYCGTQGFPFTPSGLRRQGLLSRVTKGFRMKQLSVRLLACTSRCDFIVAVRTVPSTSTVSL